MVLLIPNNGIEFFWFYYSNFLRQADFGEKGNTIVKSQNSNTFPLPCERSPNFKHRMLWASPMQRKVGPQDGQSPFYWPLWFHGQNNRENYVNTQQRELIKEIKT